MYEYDIILLFLALCCVGRANTVELVFIVLGPLLCRAAVLVARGDVSHVSMSRPAPTSQVVRHSVNCLLSPSPTLAWLSYTAGGIDAVFFPVYEGFFVGL